MSLFTDTVRQDTPRLVVMFRRGPGGAEEFQWGIVGAIPIMSLIGAVVDVQGDIASAEWLPGCDTEVPSLCVAWDDAERDFRAFLSPDIPRYGLLGMLETIKLALAGTAMSRQAAAQQIILGPDGSPVRRGRT